MTSWKILRHLIIFWSAADNPVFLRETQRPPIWHNYYARLSQTTGLALMLGGLSCYMLTLLVFFLQNLLILLVPLLGFWLLLTGLTLAPAVVGERERYTWETLRTTPLEMPAILLGKAGGALWWERDMLRVMIGALILFAAGVGLVSLVLVPTNEAGTLQIPSSLICLAALILPIVMAVTFIVDRAQYFVLIVVSMLAASASTRSTRGALAGATVTTLIIWMVDIGVAGTVLALQPGRATLTVETDWLVLVTLGPVASYMTELDIGPMFATIGLTLVARELLIRAIWQLTVQRAQAQ